MRPGEISKVAKTVVLEVHRGGLDLQSSVVPVDLELTKIFLRGLVSSARIIESGGRRIGYVHVWCYAGYTYQRALEVLLSRGAKRRARADLGFAARNPNISICSMPERQLSRAVAVLSETIGARYLRDHYFDTSRSLAPKHGVTILTTSR